MAIFHYHLLTLQLDKKYLYKNYGKIRKYLPVSIILADNRLKLISECESDMLLALAVERFEEPETKQRFQHSKETNQYLHGNKAGFRLPAPSLIIICCAALPTISERERL